MAGGPVPTMAISTRTSKKQHVATCDEEISFQFLNLNFIFRNSTLFDKVNWNNRLEGWKNADSLLKQSFCPRRPCSDQIFEGDLKVSHERTKTKTSDMPRAQPTFLVVYSLAAFLCVWDKKQDPCNYRENILSSKIRIILSYLWVYEQFSMRED